MTTAYTSLLGLALPVTGENSGTWGTIVNDSITSLLDSAIAGTTNVSTDADVTLTTTTGAANTAREAILLFSGARTAQRTVTAPAQSKVYTVINATTGGYAVTLVGAGPTTGVTIANGGRAVVAWNGSDFVELSVFSSNVGIGVTPSAWASFYKGIDVSTYAAVYGATTNNAGLINNGYFNGSNWIYKNTAAASNYSQSGGAHAWSTAASGTAGNAITFTQAMTLNSSGNLGIGTSSPASKLAVVGEARVYTGSNLGYWGVDAGNSYVYFGSNSSGYSLSFQTGGADRMRLDSSGNLGLGVTPSAWDTLNPAFQIASGSVTGYSTYQMFLVANAYYNQGWKYKTTGQASAQYQQDGNSHKWYNAPSGTAGNNITFTQAMTLDASGNLLVGTTSAIDGGSITNNYNGNNVKGLVLNDNTPATTHCYIAFDKDSGTQIGTITNNANTGVLYNVTSDYRLKTVIGAVSGSGERLDALEPIEYEWKETGLRTRGFLAHKFQEVYANSVTGTKDAVDANSNPIYQAMQAGSAEVIADLVAEIQSLRKRLADAGI